MGDYDFTDNLVTLTRFRTPTEAALALARLEVEGIEASLDGDAAATSLGGIVGTDLVGSSLLVRQGDLRRARDLLADVLYEEDQQDEAADGYVPDNYDADDWSGEDWSDDEDDPYEEYSEEPAETPPLTRAWRAAVIGGVLLPILALNVYSLWLIYRHRLWEPRPGEKSVNWRYYAALFFNLFGVLFFWAIVRWRDLQRLELW
jgi:hypothetical protein